MAATRSNNTFVEALANLNRSLADMKLLEDADLPFILNMETQLLQRARGGEQQMAQAGQLPMPAQNPAGMGALNLPLPPGGGIPPGDLGPLPGGPPPLPPGPTAAPPPSMLGAGVPGVPTGPPPATPADLDQLLA